MPEIATKPLKPIRLVPIAQTVKYVISFHALTLTSCLTRNTGLQVSVVLTNGAFYTERNLLCKILSVHYAQLPATNICFLLWIQSMELA